MKRMHIMPRLGALTLLAWLAVPIGANAQQSVSLGVAAAAGLDVKSGLTVAYVVGSPYGSAAGSDGIMALPGQIAGALAQLATPVEANAIASLRVHPSPASQWVTIDGLPAIDNACITIYSVLGQPALRAIVPRTQQGFRVDVSKLHNGIYVLRVDNGTGAPLGTARLVVNR